MIALETKARSLQTSQKRRVAFDTAPQAELLRLQAGDVLSVQGTAKLGVFEKAGKYRASLDVTANRVLALDQPKKKAAPKQETDASAPPPSTRGTPCEIQF